MTDDPMPGSPPAPASGSTPQPVPEAPPPVPPSPSDPDARPLEKRLRALEKRADEERRRREEKKARKQERAAEEGGKKKQGKKLGRGVETMFRSSYRVNMDLSQLADAKANIMVSVNGLMIPILIGTISPKIDANPWLLLPTIVLLTGVTGALVFGVLAALPRVEARDTTLDDVRQERANILFFGNFANLSRDDYVSGMEWLMKQPEVLYRSMIQDLYGVGVVLQKKYRMLRISYLLFLLGVGLGVTLFVITFFIAAAQPDVSISDAYVSPLPSVPGLAMTPPDTAATVPADTMLVGPDAP